MGHNSFFLIAGPCQIESRDHAHFTAKAIKDICQSLSIELIYKSSFDKANRSKIDSPRGVGIDEGLKILSEIKREYNLRVTTDVHETWQVDFVKNVIDMIQIPAFLCRQTDLLIAAGNTGLPVNVKKGQFLNPLDMKYVIEKIESTDNKNIFLCERGTTFGYNDIVVDFRNLEIMKNMNYPVIFDATHSCQKPANRNMILPLAKAAVAIGVDGLFMEMHEDPDNAPSDGANMIRISDAYDILMQLKNIDSVVKYIGLCGPITTNPLQRYQTDTWPSCM